ncbi:HAMP domain-containing histidine kinase [Marinomonas sp. A79]|uniref:histidine kinase n=1 Tax=Marinomonas vulgaris TaxID=2823372 RepID=A0ABS5H8L2_9GAMM|nr:HAMP domain-containing sensor histidine kinase [Marinomonas vulgaris]MBR7888038.1 HAMP domain-containing histidine kinase [Marinomonas vulgaris]
MFIGQSASKKKPLLIVCLSGILVFILLLSWGSYRFFWDSKVSQLALNEADILSRSVSAFSREVGHIKRVTLLLRNSVRARLVLQEGKSFVDANQTEFLLAPLEDQIVAEFTRFAQTSNLISQVRWLSLEGQELIRINSQNGLTTRVPNNQLQDKSDRHYMDIVPKAASNDVLISSLDLNIENKEIIRPLQPTIRGVVQVSPDVPGILVVNYDLTPLFDAIRSFNRESLYVEILDANGYWVLSQDPLLEWGGILYPDDKGANIKVTAPAIWEEMNQMNEREHLFDSHRLWSLHKVYLDEDDVTQQTGVPPLFFIARSYEEAVASWRLTLIATIFGIAGFVFYIVFWLVWRQITAQFETYRLLTLVKQEKALVERANEKLSRTNKQLVDLQDELVETSKLSSLGLMLAGLAHEMHTPLGGVRMALSSCQAWMNKEEKAIPSEVSKGINQSLSIADKNLVRALDVVASFKRIVSDRTAQEIQAFQLHNVVNDIVFTYKPVLKKRSDIRLDIDCPDDIDMLGYPGAMSQIIQNLVDNALDHAFHHRDKGVITLTAKKYQESLVLSIRDNGRGIAPDIKQHIFQPFMTTGRVKHHTGLGLHLVSQWVDKLMNGRIEFESEVGVGSCFTLTVPRFADVNINSEY